MENVFKFNQSEKVKTFVERIVAECDQEGLTVAEALAVPQAHWRSLFSQWQQISFCRQENNLQRG